MSPSPARRIAAEFMGTAWLAAGVVGSGIMGERLAAGNDAVALLANALATGGVLYAAIVVFGPVSGAHFNPLVSLEAALRRHCSGWDTLTRAGAQTLGAVAGVVIANVMFGLPWLFASEKARGELPQLLAEMMATFVLICVVRLSGSPAAIAAYIVAAYWFTASTSFANPAITLARSFTNTFSGIRPADVLAFAAAQTVGCLSAFVFTRWLQQGQKP